MSFMNDTQSYQDLTKHFSTMQTISLLDLFMANPHRADEFTLTCDGLFVDYSKNNITSETLDLLVNLAKECDLEAQIEAMFSGAKINNTENRAVLHTALRSEVNQKLINDGKDIIAEIHQVLERMQNFSERIHQKKHLGYTGLPITDIVNIGIGGSDLGPVLACHALKPYRKLNVHFVSSVDGYQLYDTLASINPATTIFIIASKTFTTQETMLNAQSVRQWFLDRVKDEQHIKQHFVAVSTNKQAVVEFGIDQQNMFEFWDFVGGRYSLWSAVGLSIILYIGYDNFQLMLAGARAMDQHFYNNKAKLASNLPVILALIGIWQRNFYKYTTQVISPYNTRLSRLPAYIQQLEMESNGKSVTKNGDTITGYETSPVIWGDSGINGQHAYYQLLHQGTAIHPMDIIVALSCEFSNKQHNDVLIANAFAQAEAFMRGKTYLEAKADLFNSSSLPLVASSAEESHIDFLAKHKTFKGNRPSNMIVLPEISPYYLGMLLALYEHKTFVQGVIWGVNSFDQMGVLLGKELANNILVDIESSSTVEIKNLQHDSSTNNLIKRYTRCL